MSEGDGHVRGTRLRRAVLVVTALGALLLAALGGSHDAGRLDAVAAPAGDVAPDPVAGPSAAPEEAGPAAAGGVAEEDDGLAPVEERPRWRTERVLPRGGMLIAYYGTAGTGALGVLGEAPPDRAHRRLARAARPFARPGRPVRLVYELIVTIADAYPGRDGDYNHDIDRAAVRRYVDAAHANGALLVLDIQPGRADFLRVARRWAWALAEPHVGLALDPEWRMGPGEVPGRVIGSVRAAEVNRVSAWLSDVVVRRDLPEKPFVLHQFRESMLPDIERIAPRDGLLMVQHVDGFGTPGQKLDTYRAVARPGRFAMGFKLFYDEDVRRMGAPGVHRIRPAVRFVSFQ